MLQELELDRGLRLGIEALGFEQATEVQRQVIPAALGKRDLKVSAATGSGKTLAYLVPLAQRILTTRPRPKSGVLALVLVPTRELARQVQKECRSLLEKTGLNTAVITGGADFKYQRSLLRKDPEILVATPGRLLEHCNKGSTDLQALQTLVLDEADRMLDLGFRDEVAQIASLCPSQRQVLMLSATPGHPGVKAVAGNLLQDPQQITVTPPRQALQNIHHQLVLADGGSHKDKLLVALLQDGNYQRALVFANKRATAQRLAGLLQYHHLRCGCLHGELSTEERKKAVTDFSQLRTAVLCASDVAARGLDIRDIDLVINYDMPHSGDDYLHRTGRTGRAGATGMAISLVAAPEWNLMISIARYLGMEFERRALPGLKARFSGPKKQKNSGKAAGTKKKKSKSPAEKKRSRQRNQKDRGRRKGGTEDGGRSNDGFAPLMKKKPSS